MSYETHGKNTIFQFQGKMEIFWGFLLPEVIFYGEILGWSTL